MLYDQHFVLGFLDILQCSHHQSLLATIDSTNCEWRFCPYSMGCRGSQALQKSLMLSLHIISLVLLYENLGPPVPECFSRSACYSLTIQTLDSSMELYNQLFFLILAFVILVSSSANSTNIEASRNDTSMPTLFPAPKVKPLGVEKLPSAASYRNLNHSSAGFITYRTPNHQDTSSNQNN